MIRLVIVGTSKKDIYCSILIEIIATVPLSLCMSPLPALPSEELCLNTFRIFILIWRVFLNLFTNPHDAEIHCVSFGCNKNAF